jgi:hypothetical protein
MIKGILFIILLFLIGIISSRNYKEYFKDTCSKKLIKPTCNRTSIFGAIRKLENDIDEISYMLENKKRSSSKYEAMYKWYQEKSMGEAVQKDKTDANTKAASDQIASSAAQQITDNKKIIAKQAKENQKKEIARLDKLYGTN